MTITSDTDTDYLQEDLNKLAEWKGKWKMTFHPDKCNVLTITRKRKPIVREYHLHGHTSGCKICQISLVYYQCRPKAERSHKEHLQQGQQNYRIPETKLEHKQQQDNRNSIQITDKIYSRICQFSLGSIPSEQ